MMQPPSIWDPDLLKGSGKAQPLKVFLCGPGYRSESFDFRKGLREAMEACGNVQVSYGEDLVQNSFRKKGVDLQTLEAEFAHSVDFTVLILDSAGSIAELGTFSMINNVRSRLFVVLSSKFYAEESYISRGPLSLISSSHNNNVIYYDHHKIQDAYSAIMRPIMLYKYLRFVFGYKYTLPALNGHRKQNYRPNYYEEKIEQQRKSFFESIVLLAVVVLETPTFAELVNFLGLDPSDVSAANKALYSGKKLRKLGSGKYQSINGFDDDLLGAYSATKISQLRAKLHAFA